MKLERYESKFEEGRSKGLKEEEGELLMALYKNNLAQKNMEVQSLMQLIADDEGQPWEDAEVTKSWKMMLVRQEKEADRLRKIKPSAQIVRSIDW